MKPEYSLGKQRRCASATCCIKVRQSAIEQARCRIDTVMAPDRPTSRVPTKRKWFNGQSRFMAITRALFFFSLILSSTHSIAEESAQRLSVWLTSKAITAEDYPLGLIWKVPGEEATQAGMKSELLNAISGSGGDAEAIHRLHGWIAEMPVTGRVPISIVDTDWLRANPNHDPLILPGHAVILPKRPRNVTLITSKGARCQLPHVSGRMARQYLAACVPDASSQIDWAWVVQPDGKINRFGIASWNAQKQDEPAPGAWIWMPYREDKWADSLSGKLAAFLGTQGIPPEREIVDSAADMSSSFMQTSNGFDYCADPIVTANDWGGAGLLQSPTARMRATSHGSMTLSRAIPYSNINIFLQPMDWMEVGFRYTSISNRLYGPAAFSGTQAYKDKSIDVKFSLIRESAYVPEIALGLRDVAGTGLFSGEFVVANKRSGAFDWSVGLGWGYLGGRGNLRNPLGLISRSFDTPRKLDRSVYGEGGTFALSNYFHGPTALFGGVQYQSPWEQLILKLEYDGNDYRHEPFSNIQRQDSPWNAGAIYHAGRSLDVTLGFERGNTLTLGITLQTELQKLATPKLDDPARVAVSVYRPPLSGIGEGTARDMASQTGWQVRSIDQNGHELRVNVDDADAINLRERTDRASAVLHRDAPEEIDHFDFVHRRHGMELVEHRVDRDAWVKQQTQPLPPARQVDSIVIRPVEQSTSTIERPQLTYQGIPPIFQFEPGFSLKYSLGGPDGFILYQLTADGRAKLMLGDSTWLQGNLQYGLIDNYDQFRVTTSSDLPRARTYVREYLTSSKITMPNLQLAHAGKLSENQYYSVYGGYLEFMFAGVGAEWMYRALESHVALGVDINHVQQRGFKQDFELRAYQVNTGHATLYWDTGWDDVLAKWSVGRYLAGDVGVTVDMSRIFPNGVRMGAFFTKTNVSSQAIWRRQFRQGDLRHHSVRCDDDQIQ